MYNGIPRETQKYKQPKNGIKKQMLTTEEEIVNGVITTKYVMKTQEFKANKDVNWRDYEINNLRAAGINPETLPETKLAPNYEQVMKDADTATEVIEEYQFIKSLENGNKDNKQQESTEAQN